ncbi:MAG: hydrogenase expression/formation protein HypE [Actinomycetota bacterium]
MTDDVITMAHGAGGKASQALTDAVFRAAYGGAELDRLDDGAVLDVPSGSRLVFTTDAFVVTPRTFAGGSIGDLAVNGTVNDLAVMGAEPRWLAVSAVLEEGLPLTELRQVVADVANAAAVAGVTVVAGDTKVVERGAADGLFLTTSGIGLLDRGVRLGAELVRPGDAVVVSGPLGDHGMAVMLARGDLALDADIRSDTAAVHVSVRALLDAVPETRWMRDPTRGGLASACNELAVAADVGVSLFEERLPVSPPVAGACELLGIDPLYVANEGKLVAVVPQDAASVAVAALRSVEVSAGAVVVGEITDDHPGLVVAHTSFGGSRIVDMLVGAPLPRIC